MKNMALKFAAIMLILAGSFISCGEKADKDQIPFTRVGNGEYGFGQDRIISSQEEWNDLLMNFGKYEVARFTETEIDFDRYVIVVIIDKARYSSGWSIFVKHIKEYPDRMVVTADVRAPQGKVFYPIITPYCIVKMSIMKKNIEFVHLN